MFKQQITQEDVQQFFIYLRAECKEKVLEMILKCGPIILNRIESQRRLPCLFFVLNFADENLRLQYFKLFIEKGASPYFQNNEGQNILFFICAKGDDNIKVIQYLLDCGMSFEKTDKFGQTPLFYLIKHSQINLLQYLIDRKVKFDVNHQDRIGQTVLFSAAIFSNLEMIKLLCRIGAKADHADIESNTADFYARRHKNLGNSKFIQFLLSNNDDQCQSSQFQDQRCEQSNAITKYKINWYQIKKENEDGSSQLMTIEQINSLGNEKLINLLKQPKNIEKYMEEYYENAPWEQKAQYYLSICMNFEGSEHFNEPVNEDMYGITGYYDIIEYPMDFSTIKQKLDNHQYSSLNEFNEDVQLVFENCQFYNGKQHIITQIALAIRQEYQSKLRL